MKWFFCWSDKTDFPEYNWKDLIRSAVYSAISNTRLDPHFIYDGEPCELTSELEAVGVKIIYHRTSFYDDIVNYAPNDEHYQRVASAAFLRFDIPFLADRDDEIVIYTDCDVIFRNDELSGGYNPNLIGAAPQTSHGAKHDLNSGVLILNLRHLRDIWKDFSEFVRKNLHLGYDQEILREFVGKRFLLLPDNFNWKPYWGENDDATLIHWHGPKPHTVSKYFDGDEAWVSESYRFLINLNTDGYKHFLGFHYDNVSSWWRLLHDESAVSEMKQRLLLNRQKQKSDKTADGRDKLGIAITTFNRVDMLRELIASIEEKTSSEYELVICDDGSSSETVAFLDSARVKYINGENRGIAWNKNRGIFALKEILGCNRIILLDDDAVIEEASWDIEWVKAIDRYGHICHRFLAMEDGIKAGTGTAEDPFITDLIQGVVVGLSSDAIKWVGYMDTRFGQYGHEHTDYSSRFRRCGYGGLRRSIDGKISEEYFLAIRGHVTADGAAISHRPDDMSGSDAFFARSGVEPIYRAPWKDDGALFDFREEIVRFCVRENINFPWSANVFDKNYYLTRNFDVLESGADAWQHFVHFGYREGRLFGLRASATGPALVARDLGAGAFSLVQEQAVDIFNRGGDLVLTYDLGRLRGVKRLDLIWRSKNLSRAERDLNFGVEISARGVDWHTIFAPEVSIQEPVGDVHRRLTLGIPFPGRYLRLSFAPESLHGFVGMELVCEDLPEPIVRAMELSGDS